MVARGNYMSLVPAFEPPHCLLLGPGPSNAEPRVLQAMCKGLLGQFDPRFTELMNEVMDLSRRVFQTTNTRTFPVSGTSRAGLEAVLGSIVQEGDRMLVGVVAEAGKPETTLVVPQAALQADQSGMYVLVAGMDNKIEVRPIEVGPGLDAYVAVRKGLSADDLVVTEGIQKVRPGQVVEATEVKPGE